MMTEILLVRHGETEWNASEIFRGRADVPLNKNGKKQARLLGEYLRGEKIDAVYSSPLQRAVKTAGAIAGAQSLQVINAPELIDIDFGDWQGLPVVEVKQKYPQEYQEWLIAPEKAKIPGGECLEDVKNRVLPFVEKTASAHVGKKVVLVSHRVVHKVLISALLGIGNSGFTRVKLDTAGITRFRYDKGIWILISHNDTSFLKSMRNLALADF
jgi:broad specificity phosphatase PhoE